MDGATPARCPWAEGGSRPDSARMVAYHDLEWGVPCHDERAFFERLSLETFQAGLSWSTILNKRDHFTRAFEDWDAERIAAYGDADVARLLADPGIVRNRLKVQAAIRNARAFLDLQAREGSFDRYAWSFVGGKPLVHTPRFTSPAAVPARTAESDAFSKDLKRRGFTFVGSTTVYAFMQSTGMVDDHLAGCFRADAPLA